MKKMILFVMVVGSMRLSADVVQETFLKAGVEYEQGHIKQALELYKKMDTFYPSVFYNRGLCQYSLGVYPQALADFRRAQRMGNKELFEKASQAVVLTQKKLGIDPDSFLFGSQMALHTLFSGDFLRILIIMLFMLLVLLVMFRRYTVKRLVALIGLIVGLGSCCFYEYWLSQQRYGVVVAQQALLYAGPDKEFHRVGGVSAGQQVKVVQQDQSWYKVYFHSEVGWVEQSDIELF